MKEYSFVESDDDSGFKDDSSVAFSVQSDQSERVTTYKVKSWNCFATKKQEVKVKQEQEENGTQYDYPRKQNVFQRATKKIFGKTKRLFNKKQQESKISNTVKTEKKLKENHTEQVAIIIPSDSCCSVNVDPAPNRQNNSFFRAEKMRCSIRESRGLNPREALRLRERQTMLRVLFDFQACDDDDISVIRGELVQVLNKDDKDWWWVENEHRQRGFVPRNFLWPCGCYVCQQFILDRVTNVNPVLSDQNPEHQRFQANDQIIREETFGERTRFIGNKRYTSTWC